MSQPLNQEYEDRFALSNILPPMRPVSFIVQEIRDDEIGNDSGYETPLKSDQSSEELNNFGSTYEGTYMHPRTHIYYACAIIHASKDAKKAMVTELRLKWKHSQKNEFPPTPHSIDGDALVVPSKSLQIPLSQPGFDFLKISIRDISGPVRTAAEETDLKEWQKQCHSKARAMAANRRALASRRKERETGGLPGRAVAAKRKEAERLGLESPQAITPPRCSYFPPQPAIIPQAPESKRRSSFEQACDIATLGTSEPSNKIDRKRKSVPIYSSFKPVTDLDPTISHDSSSTESTGPILSNDDSPGAATAAMLKDIETADVENLEAHLDQIFGTGEDVLKDDEEEIEIEPETGKEQKKSFKFLSWAKKKSDKKTKSSGEAETKKRQSLVPPVLETEEKFPEKLKL